MMKMEACLQSFTTRKCKTSLLSYIAEIILCIILCIFIVSKIWTRDCTAQERNKYTNLENIVAPRSTYILLRNYANDKLKLKSSYLDHGVWLVIPPQTILAGRSFIFSAESNGLWPSIKGTVTYTKAINTSELIIYFSNPFIGSNEYIITTTHQDFVVGHWSCKGYNAQVTITVVERNLKREYRIAIMSDPQPWRLDSNNKPNSYANKKQWENLNSKVVNSINSLALKKPIDFGIINGDITEFGRHTTRQSFYEIYDKLLFPYYYGLGNHDYSNNLNDCTEAFSFSRNACARGSVNEMSTKLLRYRYELSNFNSDYDYLNRIGSLAYSWDYGDIHYVQLQNYPTFKINLDHFAAPTIQIKTSLDWLEFDLKEATRRGKSIVLNFHDALDKFVEASSESEKSTFRSLIEMYKVLAIFSGHNHRVFSIMSGWYDSLFGNATVLCSGALFKGDYFIVNVRGKCLSVSSYNGLEEIPSIKMSIPTICGM